MATKKIGIIGDGNVGSALARGLKRAGYDVRAVGKDKTAIRETASWAEIVLLAVRFAVIDDVVKEVVSAVESKTLIDVTNALDAKMSLAVGFTTSGAEELQKKVPKARVVKAFNTQFAQHMDSGKLGDQPLTVFVAGDDAAAKSDVTQLATAIGFEAVDAGPLANSRLLRTAWLPEHPARLRTRPGNADRPQARPSVAPPRRSATAHRVATPYPSITEISHEIDLSHRMPPSRRCIRRPPIGAADGETFYVNPETGADTNAGTKEKPFKTLPAAADRVNDLKGEGAATLILSPGNGSTHVVTQPLRERIRPVGRRTCGWVTSAGNWRNLR
jgi:predicted dinucleotide-binding enzyme